MYIGEWPCPAKKPPIFFFLSRYVIRNYSRRFFYRPSFLFRSSFCSSFPIFSSMHISFIYRNNRFIYSFLLFQKIKNGMLSICCNSHINIIALYIYTFFTVSFSSFFEWSSFFPVLAADLSKYKKAFIYRLFLHFLKLYKKKLKKVLTRYYLGV